RSARAPALGGPAGRQHPAAAGGRLAERRARADGEARPRLRRAPQPRRRSRPLRGLGLLTLLEAFGEADQDAARERREVRRHRLAGLERHAALLAHGVAHAVAELLERLLDLR